MRPNTPECIFLMLGCLQKAGKKVTKLDEETIEGLLVAPEDLEDDWG